MQGFAQVAEIIRFDREQPGEHTRLYFLKTRQGCCRRPVRSREGIAHGRAVDVLDAGNDVADLAGVQARLLGALRGENPD